MPARQRMLVVGGDAGGMSAATQARRMRPIDDLEIVAFERLIGVVVPCRRHQELGIEHCFVHAKVLELSID